MRSGAVVQRLLYSSAAVAGYSAAACWKVGREPPHHTEPRLITLPAILLHAGHLMPCVGLGVYRAAAGGECYQAVLSALRLGYRHVDTAQIYGNEADVGR